MESRDGAGPRWVAVLRWIARAWSVVAIVLVLGFIVGEGINASAPNEWLGLLFFPLGICAGMIVAWQRERLGGAITVASLVIFYVIHVIGTGQLPAGFAWLAFAAPGFLFLICGLVRLNAATA